MKIRLFAVCALVLFAVNGDVAFAKTTQETRLDADQYYEQKNFNKAYKYYYKLAKKGDHHSQHQLAMMYANGEGKKTDLNEAYAWSVLAAEGAEEKWQKNSDMLLEKVTSKSRAEEEAAKLKRNYGELALEEKQRKAEKRKSKGSVASCTGSRIACKRR
jgi:TPR repeat protein